MRFESLAEWLQWQEELHFTKVDLGLGRIGKVWQQLGGSSALPFTVITVSGTNGKGSSVAMLASILSTAGYKVGSYTSPHLLEYNERICINTIACDDELICRSFDRIDTARDEMSLTYFEFATLAAVDIFCEKKIDIAILEVGMGGRLDATNLFDCDIALITPIALDHTIWLGTNREQIGAEKAGIMRQGKPVVCSQASPPQSVLQRAKILQSPIYLAEHDFYFKIENQQWCWKNSKTENNNLALPSLRGAYQIQNAAAVLQIIQLLIESHNYSISEQQISTGLKATKLAGRFQQISGDIEIIFDVTHNQQGAQNLALLLTEMPCAGRTIAVLAMMNDKNHLAVVKELKSTIDCWYVADLSGSRGISGTELAATLSKTIAADKIICNTDVVDTYQQALTDCQKGDRILVFGSFLTVEAIMKIRTKATN